MASVALQAARVALRDHQAMAGGKQLPELKAAIKPCLEGREGASAMHTAHLRTSR